MEDAKEVATSSQPCAKTRQCCEVKCFSKSIWSKDEDDRLIKIMSNSRRGRMNWKPISEMFPGKENQQVANRWRHVVNPDIKKGSWTQEEDLFILQWVKDNGAHKWDKCASLLGQRIGKQCRERWLNQLCDASHNNSKWTPEEDETLISLRDKVGNKWTLIAKALNRTENQVKNRWYSTLKRRIVRISNGLSPDLKRGRKNSRNKTATASAAPKGGIIDDIFEIPTNANALNDSENELFETEQEFKQETGNEQKCAQADAKYGEFDMFLV